MTRKKTLSMWTTCEVVKKDNFNNFFQMTMLFLVYVVTILRQLHFTKNYFFSVNISAEQLLPQSNQFKTTVTFLEHLLFQNTHVFSAAVFSKQLLIPSETSTDQHLLLVNSQLFRATSFSEQLLFRKTNLFRISISTEELLFRSRHF